MHNGPTSIHLAGEISEQGWFGAQGAGLRARRAVWVGR
jgi:hypothetical protein